MDIRQNPFVSFLTPFPPRECGIANYSKCLLEAIGGDNFSVTAIENTESKVHYSQVVQGKIFENNEQDYVSCAKMSNLSRHDLVHVQHEFGLYGGQHGGLILGFLNQLTKPAVITFHTVLSNPEKDRIKIVKRIGEKAGAVIVMAETAANRLNEIYNLDRKKIFIIPHGVPKFSFQPSSIFKNKLGFPSNRPMISIFGLLSRNKGIEYAIEAMPMILKKFPECILCIIGKTHPVVLKYDGEEYRSSLEKKIKNQKLDGNVKFIDKYLPTSEMNDYLQATDIYLAPYLEPEQITSGTLAYALGAGKPCISTPYAYAKEILNADRGFFVPFCDSKILAESVIKLLSDDKLRNLMARNNYNLGKKMTWENVGKKHLDLYRKIYREFGTKS